ncbi:FmdB family zinc ribbon protein [candidate division CSSED10-310 bacterium]|uniref:FmdB family zinc ribbon protein n=1 Tax=candidate division CSSED10-310 bacterium TaxID=2855610 RepID=A0ABV6Z3A3_UNCC1
MPLYEFQCEECQKIFTRLSPMGEDGTNLECVYCAAKPVKKIFSTFATAGQAVKSAPLTATSSSNCAPGSPFR